MEKKRPRIAWDRWALAVIAFLVGYPLSLGPLQRLVVDNHLSAWLYTLHAPLIWYIRNEPHVVTRWYWSYLNWWIVALAFSVVTCDRF